MGAEVVLAIVGLALGISAFTFGLWIRNSANSLRDREARLSVREDNALLALSPITEFEPDDKPRIYVFLDARQIMDLYGQLAVAGQVAHSVELESSRDHTTEGKLAWRVISLGGSRKRGTKEKQSFTPERDPARALKAIELRLSSQSELTDLSIASRDRDSDFVSKHAARVLGRMTVATRGMGVSITSALADEIRKQVIENLTTQDSGAMAQVAGYVRVRGTFEISTHLQAVTFTGRSEAGNTITAKGSSGDLAQQLDDRTSRRKGILFGMVLDWDSPTGVLLVQPISFHLA